MKPSYMCYTHKPPSLPQFNTYMWEAPVYMVITLLGLLYYCKQYLTLFVKTMFYTYYS